MCSMYNTSVYDLDRTQEWLRRTQQIGRPPPVRGGVVPDVRARRQTLACVGASAAVLAGLALLPGPRGPAPAAPRAVALARARWLPARAMDASGAALHAARATGAPTSGMPGIASPPPAGSHVAPPAPVWLDGAARW
ncbi:MAG: hypothetical protein IT208_00550 [Chthonomonadales bacterium]|nr:hypothetical protein [Chthonomonadales bacterium]